MDAKMELHLAYGLAIVLLIVGVFSYAAFSARAPEQPVRLMYTSATGKVLFDHKTHLADAGYGISCGDCHHHPAEDDSALRACGDCHLKSVAEEAGPAETCLECHDAEEIEDEITAGRPDAFHSQCIDCHQAFGAGPVECAACHVQ